jgi:hypothetical protein
MNPPVMALPTLAAAFVAKWPHVRKSLLDHIRSGVQQEASRAAMEETLKFVAGGNWTAPAEVPQ